MSKRPCISLIIVSRASILLTMDVVPKIFPTLNVIGHLPVPAGWGSCLPRLAIFVHVTNIFGAVIIKVVIFLTKSS